VSVTSITVDGARDNTFSTTLTTDDYELLPRNALLGSEAWPYTQIQLTTWGDMWAWLPGARIKVTGVWGWPSVPAPIFDAVIDLTRIKRREMPETDQVLTEATVLDGVRAYGRLGL
jgi:hypothetical protein